MYIFFFKILKSHILLLWGHGPKSYNWVLDFSREREKSESEEEYLLRLAKRRSGIDPNDQSDLLENSNDRNVHHKHTRKMGTQKYLRESCYHSIECFVANSLAALMRK